MGDNLIDSLFIFMLACFIGFEVIRHVSPLLHTPLMSLTNALDAIAVVGAIVLVGERKSTFATVLGVIAIVAATRSQPPMTPPTAARPFFTLHLSAIPIAPLSWGWRIMDRQ